MIQETNADIPYAHIIIEKSGSGTVANSEGYFNLNFESKNKLKYLLFSSIGYSKDSVQLTDKSINTGVKIILRSEVMFLDEIEITNKKLDVNEILRNAVRRIEWIVMKINY